jgi:DNA-binding transcriptional ArsR family regulator
MGERAARWTVFSSHGLVLLCLAATPGATLRRVSDALGITERQVARIVGDLREAGMVTVRREGRRNAYAVDRRARLRHPTLADVPLGRLLDAVAGADAE